MNAIDARRHPDPTRRLRTHLLALATLPAIALLMLAMAEPLPSGLRASGDPAPGLPVGVPVADDAGPGPGPARAGGDGQATDGDPDPSPARHVRRSRQSLSMPYFSFARS